MRIKVLTTHEQKGWGGLLEDVYSATICDGGFKGVKIEANSKSLMMNTVKRLLGEVEIEYKYVSKV